MTRICYVPRNFTPSSLALIDHAEQIIQEYTEQGYQLTLRQLYYQFVSRDLIPNTMRSYKNLGSVINDARLAGLLDWESIEDRTRNLQALAHWDTPREIVEACANQYRRDIWEDQPVRVECWIEKDALSGVIEDVCNKYDVPFFACRGYTSQSEQWRAGQRFIRHIEGGQGVIVLNLGDHDPSGIDMTRDNLDRLRTFIENESDGTQFEVVRLALNMEQVKKHRPPPNPAKFTDSRASGYVQKYGRSSWELDALEPKVINKLVEDAILSVVDGDKIKAALDRISKERESIAAVAKTL